MPNPTIEIMRKCEHCLLGGCCLWTECTDPETGYFSPGPDCPGPGIYKLVKVEE